SYKHVQNDYPDSHWRKCWKRTALPYFAFCKQILCLGFSAGHFYRKCAGVFLDRIYYRNAQQTPACRHAAEVAASDRFLWRVYDLLRIWVREREPDAVG